MSLEYEYIKLMIKRLEIQLSSLLGTVIFIRHFFLKNYNLY
jgi:mannitol/fructose-specific phosphotransferase system IIA component